MGSAAQQETFRSGYGQILQPLEGFVGVRPLCQAEVQVGQSQEGGQEVGGFGEGGLPVEGSFTVLSLLDGEDSQVMADQVAAQSGVDGGWERRKTGRKRRRADKGIW
jgi:hypothetical protein